MIDFFFLLCMIKMAPIQVMNNFLKKNIKLVLRIINLQRKHYTEFFILLKKHQDSRWLVKCDLHETGAFSEAAWSDFTEDAELGDCPSSSLLIKAQVHKHTFDFIKITIRKLQQHTWIFSRLLLESVSEMIRGWT